jgi:SAM-dependent methyltransferase
MVVEQYQDIWRAGEVVSPGVRECSRRYEMVRGVAARFKRPFTVLDIGANLGYFSMRLAHEFPDCTVVAVEGMYGDWLEQLLAANGERRVILLKKTMGLGALWQLADSEHFDMVLALSVMHHIPGGFGNVLEVLRAMGSVLVAELANESGACNPQWVAEGTMPDDAVVLGHGASHLDGHGRAVWMVQQDKHSLTRAYIGTPQMDVDLRIRAGWDEKVKVQRGVETPWERGINLRTYLELGGVWPTRAYIREMVVAARPEGVHGDLKAHNAILAGDRVTFVDALDPRRMVEDDDATFAEILRELGG